jgi:CMP-N-acetylneuraminic acid synthetase
MFAVRSQDLKPKYFDTGTFVAYPTRLMKESVGAASENHLVRHEVDSIWMVDIDSEDDWRKAEELFRWRAASLESTHPEASAR